MNKKEIIPSKRGDYSVEELSRYESRIAVIRGLISYHERMVSPLVFTTTEMCGKNICPAVAFENDVYLDALKEALRLMECEIASHKI